MTHVAHLHRLVEDAVRVREAQTADVVAEALSRAYTAAIAAAREGVEECRTFVPHNLLNPSSKKLLENAMCCAMRSVYGGTVRIVTKRTHRRHQKSGSTIHLKWQTTKVAEPAQDQGNVAVDCSVCQTDTGVARALVPCGHLFCDACATKVLEAVTNCPVCRGVVWVTQPLILP